MISLHWLQHIFLTKKNAYHLCISVKSIYLRLEAEPPLCNRHYVLYVVEAIEFFYLAEKSVIYTIVCRFLKRKYWHCWLYINIFSCPNLGVECLAILGSRVSLNTTTEAVRNVHSVSLSHSYHICSLGFVLFVLLHIRTRDLRKRSF